MKFPRLPYQGTKQRIQTQDFRGLNLSEDYRDGEMTDSYGISTASYPCITQRQKREILPGYDNITEVFEWDGKLITVQGGMLYYDGVPTSTVLDGIKQFAVVNTQLIVMPDMLCIDLKNNTYRHMDESAQTSGIEGECVFYNDANVGGVSKLTANLIPKVAEHERHPGSYEVQYGSRLYIYTYGNYNNIEQRERFLACWDAVNKEWDEAALASICPNPTEVHESGLIYSLDGVMYICKAERNAYYPDLQFNSSHVERLVNTEGYFGVFVDSEHSYQRPGLYRPYSDAYNAGTGSIAFKDVFFAGDIVNITGVTGTDADKYNLEKIKIEQIDEENNALIFPQNTFPDGEKSVTDIVVIQRAVPKLDYICEAENRLWGVSNEDKTIYASSLGLPCQFYNTGTDSDSWAVAVGSENDFTAICQYGGAVCCWKENHLHKVFGSVPSDFYTTEAILDGVQKGSARSVVNVNDTLFYKGVFGIYAYQGGAPQNIGYNFGTHKYTDGCGGSEGSRYYLSMKEGDNGYTFVYDTQRNLWVKQDNFYIDAFTVCDSKQHFIHSNKLYATACAEESFEWMAEFCPWDEDAFIKKGFTKLLLRVDMTAGSWLKIDIKEDRKPWREAYTQAATRFMTLRIPIRLGRCDRYQVRLRGYGAVTVRDMAREFSVGSEV